MTDRDCEHCIHRKVTTGCEVWECDFQPKEDSGELSEAFERVYQQGLEQGRTDAVDEMKIATDGWADAFRNQGFSVGYQQGRQDALRLVELVEHGRSKGTAYLDDRRMMLFTSWITLEFAEKVLGLQIKEQKK